MYHCLLDTSSLVKRYQQEKGTSIINQLFERKDCFLNIVNLTIPEVIQTFYTLHRKGEINFSKREELKEIFMKDISEYILYVHNISDRNIADVDRIFDISFQVSPKCRTPISVIDTLIISVASGIQKHFGSAYLFTSDWHMERVASKLGVQVVNPQKISSLTF